MKSDWKAILLLGFAILLLPFIFERPVAAALPQGSEQGVRNAAQDETSADERDQATDANSSELDSLWETLLIAARDEDVEVRIAAMKSLAYMSPMSDPVIRQLRDAMLSTESTEAHFAFEALKIGLAEHERGISIWIEELKSASSAMRLQIAALIRAKPEEALMPIMDLLESNMVSDELKKIGFQMLTSWGPKAAPAKDRVLEFVDPDDPHFREALLAIAAMQVRDAAVIEKLSSLAQSDSKEVRLLAVASIGSLATGGKNLRTAASYARTTVPQNVAETFLTRYDANKDGVLTAEDGRLPDGMLGRLDSDSDGKITREEINATFGRQVSTPRETRVEPRR